MIPQLIALEVRASTYLQAEATGSQQGVGAGAPHSGYRHAAALALLHTLGHLIVLDQAHGGHEVRPLRHFEAVVAAHALEIGRQRVRKQGVPAAQAAAELLRYLRDQPHGRAADAALQDWLIACERLLGELTVLQGGQRAAALAHLSRCPPEGLPKPLSRLLEGMLEEIAYEDAQRRRPIWAAHHGRQPPASPPPG